MRVTVAFRAIGFAKTADILHRAIVGDLGRRNPIGRSSLRYHRKKRTVAISSGRARKRVKDGRRSVCLKLHPDSHKCAIGYIAERSVMIDDIDAFELDAADE
jgi:hypothetical protein